MLTTTNINLKQLDWVPQPGEHRFSVDVSKVTDLVRVWELASAAGAKPELAAIVFPSRVEVHLMLVQEQLPSGTVLGFELDALRAELESMNIPDDAIRHTYGGQMAVEPTEG
ncbi:MAG: hypothetical protein RBJ76_05925 [Stenomitos frigidus ULC029]